VLRERCVAGIKADRERCLELLERSTALVTALAPAIGYEAAAGIAKEALRTGRTVRELALEGGRLSQAELDELLDPAKMIHPGPCRPVEEKVTAKAQSRKGNPNLNAER